MNYIIDSHPIFTHISDFCVKLHRKKNKCWIVSNPSELIGHYSDLGRVNPYSDGEWFTM